MPVLDNQKEELLYDCVVSADGKTILCRDFLAGHKDMQPNKWYEDTSGVKWKLDNSDRAEERMNMSIGKFNAKNNSWCNLAYKWAKANNYPMPSHVEQYWDEIGI